MPVPTPEILIFTDLDGTLLDHFDYGFAAAAPLLERLEKSGIPVIPATSKTRAEMLAWRRVARNRHPLIVENGAAVLVPQGYFSVGPSATDMVDGFHVMPFAEPRVHWQDLLAEARVMFPGCWQSFDELGVDGIARLTDLDPTSAALAARREYGEPLNWLGSGADLSRFRYWMHDHGANILVGGRFVHVSGRCDKGSALSWLTDLYRQQPGAGRIITIALGDSDNDIAMLRAADYPVVVRSPNHPPEAVIESADPPLANQRITPAVATQGWVEGVAEVMRRGHHAA